MDAKTKERLELPLLLPHEGSGCAGRPLLPETKEKIEELYCQGRNYTEIARELKVSTSTVSNHCTANRRPLAVRILEKRIVSVVQECEIKSLMVGGKSKSIQINAPIQMIGDKAIEAGLSGEEPFKAQNCLEAMDYLLDHLPEPRYKFLKALAVGAAIRRHGQLNPAATELGISFRAIRYLKDKAKTLGLPVEKYLGAAYHKYMPKMKFEAIEDGEVTCGE